MRFSLSWALCAWVVPVAPSLGFTLQGCTGSARRECAALEAAVDRYRQAGDAAKPAQARALADFVCTDAAVCEAKRTCLGAIDPTTRALTLKNEVAARLVDLEEKRLSPDAPEAEALPAKLDEATRSLEEGRIKMVDCDRRLVDLRARFAG